jgi:hypothetical protein
LVPSHPSRVCRVALLLSLAIDHHGELLVWRLLDAEEQVFKLCGTYGRQHLGTQERKVSFGQLLADRGGKEGGNCASGGGYSELQKKLEIGCLRG